MNVETMSYEGRRTNLGTMKDEQWNDEGKNWKVGRMEDWKGGR